MTRPGSLLGWNLLALAPGAELSTPGPGITPVSPASSISVSGLNLSFSPRLIILLRACRSQSEINTKSLREIKTWGENIRWAQQQTTSRSESHKFSLQFSEFCCCVELEFHVSHSQYGLSLSLFSLTSHECFLETVSGKIWLLNDPSQVQSGCNCLPWLMTQCLSLSPKQG